MAFYDRLLSLSPVSLSIIHVVTSINSYSSLFSDDILLYGYAIFYLFNDLFTDHYNVLYGSGNFLNIIESQFLSFLLKIIYLSAHISVYKHIQAYIYKC